MTDWRETDNIHDLRTIAKNMGVQLPRGATVEEAKAVLSLKLETMPAHEEEKPKKVASMHFGPMQAKLRAYPRVVVRVAYADGSRDNVVASVNTVVYSIPRDQECILPEPVVQHLENCRKKEYRWDDSLNANSEMEVPAFSISRIRMATEEDLEKERSTVERKKDVA